MKFRWHKRAVLFVGGRRITQDNLKAEMFSKRMGRWTDSFEHMTVDGRSSLAVAMMRIFVAIRDRRTFCVTRAKIKSSANLRNGDTFSAWDPADDWKNEPRFQCMSSGSTGSPRRVERTHKSWIKSFERNSELFPVTLGDAYAVFGELTHSLSLYAALEALYLGCDLHLLTGIRPERQLDALSNSGVSVIYATPTQMRMLGQAQRRTPGVQLERVRLALIGGSKLDPGTAGICRKLLPNAEIHEFYGSSETSFVTISGRDSPAGSVGLPYPEVEISIRDGSKSLGDTGLPGEIWVRSPYLFSGYASGDPGSTRWDNGFLTVGEKGWLDAKGHLFLAGRSDRMITVADQNVYPEEIENFLLRLPGIEHAAIVSIPDPMRGNRLVAAIRAENPNLTSNSVISDCRSALGPLKAPKLVRFVDEWPMLRSGKTDIGKLELMVAELIE